MAHTKNNIMTLSVSRLPPSLNQWQRMHWGHRRKLQKVWDDEILFAWGRRKHRTPTAFQGEVKVMVWLCFGEKRERDQDNYAPKVILDALQHCDIIEADDAEHCHYDIEIHASVSFVGTVVSISPAGEGTARG